MTLLKMQVINRKISELKHAEYNPRKISVERLEDLRKSIRHDPGFFEVRPCIVNMYPGREGVLIAGNQRMEAAKLEGWENVPVIEVSVEPEKEREWNIKDNNIYGEWDRVMLGGLLKQMKHTENVGLSQAELAAAIAAHDMRALEKEDISIDMGRRTVVTVETPESPRLKARASFYFDSKEDFDRVMDFFDADGGVLNAKLLLKIIDEQ